MVSLWQQDEDLLKSVLSYYRLMAAWMLRMASPAAAAGGQPQLPLPTPAPENFRMLPVGPIYHVGAFRQMAAAVIQADQYACVSTILKHNEGPVEEALLPLCA